MEAIMSRDKDGNLVIKVDLTNTDIFNEFKNITYRMLKDERIDCLVRDEYWNEVMTWLADSLDNKVECSCTECSCKEKFKITCQTAEVTMCQYWKIMIVMTIHMFTDIT